VARDTGILYPFLDIWIALKLALQIAGEEGEKGLQRN